MKAEVSIYASRRRDDDDATLVFRAIDDFIDRLARVWIATGDESCILHPRAFAANRQRLPDCAADKFGDRNPQCRSFFLRQFVLAFVEADLSSDHVITIWTNDNTPFLRLDKTLEKPGAAEK